VLTIVVLALGPGWQFITSFDISTPSQSAGRWAGILLVSIFGIYVAGIMYGIKQGNVVPPEDSDSDSDTSDEEDEGRISGKSPQNAADHRA
jgi:hypothetical protein